MKRKDDYVARKHAHIAATNATAELIKAGAGSTIIKSVRESIKKSIGSGGGGGDMHKLRIRIQNDRAAFDQSQHMLGAIKKYARNFANVFNGYCRDDMDRSFLGSLPALFPPLTASEVDSMCAMEVLLLPSRIKPQNPERLHPIQRFSRDWYLEFLKSDRCPTRLRQMSWSAVTVEASVSPLPQFSLFNLVARSIQRQIDLENREFGDLKFWPDLCYSDPIRAHQPLETEQTDAAPPPASPVDYRQLMVHANNQIIQSRCVVLLLEAMAENQESVTELCKRSEIYRSLKADKFLPSPPAAEEDGECSDEDESEAESESDPDRPYDWDIGA